MPVILVTKKKKEMPVILIVYAFTKRKKKEKGQVFIEICKMSIILYWLKDFRLVYCNIDLQVL